MKPDQRYSQSNDSKNGSTKNQNLPKNSDTVTQPRTDDKEKQTNPLLELNPQNHQSMKQFAYKWQSDIDQLYEIYETMSYMDRKDALVKIHKFYFWVLTSKMQSAQSRLNYGSMFYKDFLIQLDKRLFYPVRRKNQSRQDFNKQQRQVATVKNKLSEQPCRLVKTNSIGWGKKIAGLFTFDTSESMFQKISSLFSEEKLSICTKNGGFDKQQSQCLLRKNID